VGRRQCGVCGGLSFKEPTPAPRVWGPAVQGAMDGIEPIGKVQSG